MNEKTKTTLSPEKETLLITLYTKAQPGNPLFFDPKAQDILNQMVQRAHRIVYYQL
jgi:hypothetical protein